MKLIAIGLPLLFLCQRLFSQTLDLPARPASAPSGSEFAASVTNLERPEREEKIFAQVTAGNVPDFLRKLVPVRVHDGTNAATYFVTPDYLAVGSDADYFLTPLTPAMAQRIADLLHCGLPTRKMVDEIYAAAAVKLEPAPIPPSAAMTTVPVFIQHNATVLAQRKAQLAARGELVAGHKKDVVISARLAAAPGKVAIYGWHQLDGKPIQPLYTGHADTWADYSHGVRLVQSKLEVNGAPKTLPEVLADPILAGLLSDEGVITNSRYSPAPPARAVTLADFKPAPFDERVISYAIEPDVKIHIDTPAHLDTNAPLKLIFFALPNGNTIEQTVGRQLKPGDDWHLDIQHIGAQTRFLRAALTNCGLVVVYLEAGGKSWPAWRKAHANQPQLIRQMVDSIKGIFQAFPVRVTLSGHSGGGSFIFGYLNATDSIPDDVERIAFLDSNYAYDENAHKAKLGQWLKASPEHFLSVLAYNDAVALLDGKPFVTPAGGTWGRSHAMLNDLDPDLKFLRETNADFETASTLGGRVKFLLKENPDKKIFHTVQVERNGFIQSILSGTPLEGRGYVYFGDRAYTKWIGAE